LSGFDSDNFGSLIEIAKNKDKLLRQIPIFYHKEIKLELLLMKSHIKIIICFLSICFGMQLSAQDYDINFAIVGNESVYLDSIKIENTIQNTEITIDGFDILNLIGQLTSIRNINVNNPKISVFPNPTSENAILRFENPQKGKVKVQVIDIHGKLIHTTSSIVPQGEVSYSLSNIGKGVYVVHVSSNSIHSSTLLISSNSNKMNQIVEINKTAINENPYSISQLKSIAAGAFIEMKYNNGENLRLTANLNEMQSVITNFTATQDETVEFSFNHSITFTVSDGTYPIQDASITVNSENLTTDVKGIATVSLSNGTYSYTVTATGFDTIADGRLTVNNSAFDESVNMDETFEDADAPVRYVHENLSFQSPWGYENSDNALRSYPLLVSGMWGEGQRYYNAVAQYYPSFVIDYQKDLESDGQALGRWIKSAIDAGYRIDLDRIYLTGFSRGGSGSYSLAKGMYAEDIYFAAIIRCAGQSQSDLGNDIAQQTAVWYHIGLSDTETRVEVARNALEYMRNYECNSGAFETYTSDEITGYERTTVTLTRSGYPMFKYSEYTDMGHDPGPCYIDESLFSWLFNHSLKYL
jgi:hypothetical protein